LRIAALYDIHGNIDALDAVLTDIEKEQIDLIVIGGDIAWGPFPGETVRRVRDLGDRAVTIRGNADREVASRAGETDGLEPWVADVNLWCADRLVEDEIAYLRTLPQTVTIGTPVLGDVLFCHGTPHSDEEIVTAATPDEDLARVLRGVDQRLVVCGHTHVQFDRKLGRTRVVNAGSVGLPYEDAPGAYWALLGDDIHLRRTEYDVHAAAARVLGAGCPHAGSFAETITSSGKRSEAIEAFEAVRRVSGPCAAPD
jgi:putative phosphoesterase